MRLGTQTLIQALTAIPWTDDPENEEEPVGPDNDARLSEDEDDDKFGTSLRIPFSGLAN
jgi:sterol 3beta-glucosyltransferase